MRSQLPRLSVGAIAILGCAVLSAGLGCAKEIPEPGGEAIDFDSPKSVVSHIFWAAREGRTESLSTLCARDLGNTAVRRVCDVTITGDDYAAFRENFAKGKLNGEPRISADRAVLKFLYGPDGSIPETMKLARKDGRWVLESF